MIKEYGIYRTDRNLGKGSNSLVEVQLGFISYKDAEDLLLEESNNSNGNIKFKYKGPEYIIIPYYKNNE